jgi:circadian clock protein KaiB
MREGSLSGSIDLGTKRYAVPKWQRSKAFVKTKVTGTEWDLRLYVAGSGSRSLTAFRNLELICDEHCAGHYKIEIVDLTKNPQRAQDDRILALPALVRKGIFPSRKIIGTLADAERVLASLLL